MNYLQLVNRARSECGVSSAALANFSSLASSDQRIVNWVAQAWEDLQMENPDWQFMQKSFTFATVDAQQLYSPTAAGAADAMDWKRDSFRCYTTAIGFGDEQFMVYMDDNTFRDVYLFGQNRSIKNRPIAFSIDPQTRGLNLGPLPLVGYTINGLYYRAPTQLVNTTDSPSDVGNDLAARWHMLLVWMAAQAYANYEAAGEVKQRADTEVARLKDALEIEQSPGIDWGAPLA